MECEKKAPDTTPNDKQGEQSNINFSDDILLRNEVNYFNSNRCCLPSYLRCEQTTKHCQNCGMFRRKAKIDLHHYPGRREDLPKIQPKYKSALFPERKKNHEDGIDALWKEAIEYQKKKRSDVL